MKKQLFEVATQWKKAIIKSKTHTLILGKSDFPNISAAHEFKEKPNTIRRFTAQCCHDVPISILCQQHGIGGRLQE
jgi:hypothetical protein